MTRTEFEAVLDRAAQFLTTNLRTSTLYHGPEPFEQGVLAALQNAAADLDVTVEPTYHRHAFPDIRVNGFGVEVKYSKRDTWNAVGNSVFESMRDPTVHLIYVIFGKVGGQPEARWGKYEDCVTHVRVSNAPRFVVDMDSQEPPLFERFEISYDDFADLDDDGKMQHVRNYWRDRLPPGEHLWWLEPEHTLPLAVRLYTHLSPDEKRMLRAESALLCPGVVRSGSIRGKYAESAVYALTHWGVLCPQARDLFTAGSVAEHIPPIYYDEPYISRAMRGIEHQMIDASLYLESALFEEYWGLICPPAQRLETWLQMADDLAVDWHPSAVLFQNLG